MGQLGDYWTVWRGMSLLLSFQLAFLAAICLILSSWKPGTGLYLLSLEHVFVTSPPCASRVFVCPTAC